MTQVSFGTILRETRIKKGYDIATVARRLRIRPDILQTLENSDFNHMPPKGYTRNMVNAYARLLELNPTEITKMYLDQCYAYQVEVARQSAQPTGFDMSGAAGRRTQAQRTARSEDRVSHSSAGRTLYLDDSHGERMRRADPGNRERLYPEERTHRSNRAAVPGTQYTNFYSGPRAPKSGPSIMVFVIAGVVILILLIVVLFLVFGPKAGADGDVPSVPVSGVSGENGASGVPITEEEDTKPVETAPTKVVFTYEIADGQSAYIEFHDLSDGGDVITEAGEYPGPTKKNVDVASVIKFVTTNPDGVKVFQDGVEVALADPNSLGIYEYTIDYPAVLAAWQAEHAAPTTPEGAAADGTDPEGADTAADGGSEG